MADFTVESLQVTDWPRGQPTPRCVVCGDKIKPWGMCGCHVFKVCHERDVYYIESLCVQSSELDLMGPLIREFVQRILQEEKDRATLRSEEP